MAAISREDRTFKRAVIFSVSAHLALFLFILISPYLPKPKSKGMVHYVNVINLPGGGGARGGGRAQVVRSENTVETPTPQRESLRDLTTPQKLEQSKPPSMTYPVEKPKRDKKVQPQKKTVIQKSLPADTKSQTTGDPSGTEGGTGSGVGIGIGEGEGEGFGFGPGYGSEIGYSNFPFTFYLQTLQARISRNWITAQIRTGLTGRYITAIRFRILRNGQITEPEIVQTSGIRSMDLSAKRAVLNAAPFPALPNEYEGEYMQIQLYFEHNK